MGRWKPISGALRRWKGDLVDDLQAIAAVIETRARPKGAEGVMPKRSSALMGGKVRRIGLNVFVAGIFSAGAATCQAAAIKVMKR